MLGFTTRIGLCAAAACSRRSNNVFGRGVTVTRTTLVRGITIKLKEARTFQVLLNSRRRNTLRENDNPVLDHPRDDHLRRGDAKLFGDGLDHGLGERLADIVIAA